MIVLHKAYIQPGACHALNVPRLAKPAAIIAKALRGQDMDARKGGLLDFHASGFPLAGVGLALV
jgi:hypothetical protein